MPAFNVKKTIQINAPREQVYALVQDFRSWPTWSPWLIAEPTCTVTHADDHKSYAWDGQIVGSGNMAIKKENEPQSIDYDLNFLKPWKSYADVRFVFAEKDGGTEVTWSMESSLPWFMFWMTKMMICFIGMDYERGLKMLKDLIETGSVPSKLEFPGTQPVAARRYVGIRTACPVTEIEKHMGSDFTKLKEWLRESGAQPSGKPLSIYHKWDFKTGTTEYTIGFPMEGALPQLPAGFVEESIPECEAYLVKHTGPYRHLGNAWGGGMIHGRAKKFRQSRKTMPFETYENDPDEVSEEELVTIVHFPVK